MSRLFAFLLAVLLSNSLFAPAQAAGLGGLARVAEGASVNDHWFGGATLSLPLTQAVPFRAYTLDNPPRLVIDFQEVDWTGFDAEPLADTDAIQAMRTGAIEAGWSRLIADLNGPLVLDTADLAVKEDSSAMLTVSLGKADPQRFAATSGAPANAFVPDAASVAVAADALEDKLVIVLDPGHGGVDPGAERDGIIEKHLMLTFARELKENLQRRGDIYVILTRQDDSFVSLERRVSIAHQLEADLFISLHADALAEGRARGAIVHTLAPEASDTATENLAERHNRADLLSGEDLTGVDDKVAQVLLDLARQETQPRTDALAAIMVEELDRAGIASRPKPLRHGGFSVLKSADIPSILVEIGFMSDPKDLANLRDPSWRKFAADTMISAILQWNRDDLAKRGLVRN